MKKYLIAVGIFIVAAFIWNTAYYRLGIYIDLHPDEPVSTFMKTDEKNIYMEKDGEYVPFEIRGVDLEPGIPGEWPSDFAIDKKTYLRWFKQIQDMGANTVRVYTILNDDFYNAFYEYNKYNDKPLYLLQGVWISDYDMFSHMDAFDADIMTTFSDDCRTMIDVIHGKKSLALSYGNKGNGSFRKDVSPWVIGYILGVDWEQYTVTYTNQKNEGRARYSGKYFGTTEDAAPFEAFLAEVGDKAVEYESERYKQQRLVAFANWANTDPFVYPPSVVFARQKVASVDVEHIKPNTENFISGMFASYHVYSYFPDYLNVMRDTSQYSDAEISERLGSTRWATVKYRTSKLKGPRIEDYVSDESYIDSYGRYNTYLAYLKALTSYHTMPVVIAEYGLATGRGLSQEGDSVGRTQGYMSEAEQGQGLIDCYSDIMNAGCAGSCLFTWQDEWFKRNWNTMHAVDLDKTPYWSDYQTNEQFFGVLTFDPGKQKSVCYADGDISEWEGDDPVAINNGTELYVKYDEKFIYFLVRGDGLKPGDDTLYIPIDTTPKSGSAYCENYDVSFDKPCDFLMVIHGADDSRVVVNERYEVLKVIYGDTYYGEIPYSDPPARDSSKFVDIYLPITMQEYIRDRANTQPTGKKSDTGRLRLGNANPDSDSYDSLADFAFGENAVEIRIPWQLLNFSNPSEMMIHDDYYEHYGIENLNIDKMSVGASADKSAPVSTGEIELEPWYKTVKTHERFKKSYYMLKDFWNTEQESPAEEQKMEVDADGQ